MMNANTALGILNRENIIKNIYVGISREGYYPDAVKVEVPFKNIEGYLYVRLCDSDDGISFLVITKGLLEYFGVDVAEATDVALRNTKESAVVTNLGELLFGIKNQMWVVSNADKVRGASAILNIEKIKEVTGFDNFVILPSSIHECLVVDEDDCGTDDELINIISAVNSNEVDEKEQLGDKPIHVHTMYIA